MTLKPVVNLSVLLLSTCRGVTGAGGHRGGLEDDGVTAGRQPNCHLLVKDPTWSLERGNIASALRNQHVHNNNNLCVLLFFI